MTQDSRKTFGRTIASARKGKGYSLKYVAAQVIKEDGEPITHQYLSDLENDRKNPPPDYIIKQLAAALDIKELYLYVKAKRLPPNIDTESEGHATAITNALEKVEAPVAA